jgi:hypothetical protein
MYSLKDSSCFLKSHGLLGFFCFGLYDATVGVIHIVRKIPVVNALGNTLPGSSFVILVQAIGSTEKGKPCILCAALDAVLTQQFVPQRVIA